MNKSTRDYYALNLTESQTDRLISKVEVDITAMLTDLSQKSGPLKEVETMYLELKHEYDAIEAELNDSKSLLEALMRFKSNTKGNKEIRVLRTTSITEKGERQQRSFKWVSMAVEVLTKKDRFLDPAHLFQEILKAFPEIERSYGGDHRKLNHVKNTTLNNFNRSCEECKSNNRGKIIMYQHKIGLFSWTLDDFIPEPRYLKEFVHGRKLVEL